MNEGMNVCMNEFKLIEYSLLLKYSISGTGIKMNEWMNEFGNRWVINEWLIDWLIALENKWLFCLLFVKYFEQIICFYIILEIILHFHHQCSCPCSSLWGQTLWCRRNDSPGKSQSGPESPPMPQYQPGNIINIEVKNNSLVNSHLHC